MCAGPRTLLASGFLGMGCRGPRARMCARLKARQAKNRFPATRTLRFLACTAPSPVRQMTPIETKAKEETMAYFTITAPVKGKDDKTRYPRVGVLFENHNRETGEVFYTIKLDFPVGVTELVAFPPKPRDDDEVTE